MSGRGVPDLSLYLVTSSELAGRGRLVDTVVAATTGGVSLVQLREPDADAAEDDHRVPLFFGIDRRVPALLHLLGDGLATVGEQLK